MNEKPLIVWNDGSKSYVSAPAPTCRRFRLSLRMLLMIIVILCAAGAYGLKEWRGQPYKEANRVYQLELREFQRTIRARNEAKERYDRLLRSSANTPGATKMLSEAKADFELADAAYEKQKARWVKASDARAELAPAGRPPY